MKIEASVLRGSGYLISIVSVVLLGIVTWKSASEDTTLMLALIGGMVASIAGMLLRWLSHRAPESD